MDQCYSWALHGGACPPKSYILMKAWFRQSTCMQLLKENVIVTVLLE